MDVQRAREFVERNHRAVLHTNHPDGRPHLTPVSAGLDGDGRVIISATEDRVKVRNLRRDPRAAVCVMNDRFYGGSVQVDGPAEIVSLPEAMEPLIDYYRRVAGRDHPDWDDYRRAMERERRCLIRITIERTTP
jgi:PPOX class probable F420-dependent enzyme